MQTTSCIISPTTALLHSDNLTKLVDDLAAPLQTTDKPLLEQELIVLYSACYLHDIGLQYERAGDTQTIRGLGLIPPWADLAEETRRETLRNYHHLISAEMVRSSVRAESPIIGIQLTSDYDPSRVASLCEAHNLYLERPSDHERYRELTEDGPNIRMGLISGLLRLADILDESRRRALRERERTLLLPLESQAHWWRHYYTESVTFDENERTITVWFDFPPDRFPDYSKVVPELQMPWIRAELDRHRMVFNKNGLNWLLTTQLNADFRGP